MDSSLINTNEDVSDLLAKDLAKRLIEKDNDQIETNRKVKKIKYTKERTVRKSVDNYSLVDLKYINKTPDEIIENTLAELSSLNDLINHALDKTLGLNESTKPLNLIDPKIISSSSKDVSKDKSSTSIETETKKSTDFNDFKIPRLPTSKQKSNNERSEDKLSSSKERSLKNKSSKLSPSTVSNESLSKKCFNEDDLIQSIANEVIRNNETKEDGEIDDEDKLKHKKRKKKKEDKHKHHCSKHRKRKESVEIDRQSSTKLPKENFNYDDDHPFKDSNEDMIEKYDDYKDKNYETKTRSNGKRHTESDSSSNKYYSDEEYDETSRKYDSTDRYYNKSKSRYHYELDSRSYKIHDSQFERNFDKYYDKYKDKNYDKHFDRSYDEESDRYHDYKFHRQSDYKEPLSMNNKSRNENTLSDWTKICSRISKDQDDDNSSIESRDFYSDDDDTRSIISERILNRDALKTKEIKFEIRDFKSRQARSANEIKQEIMDQFPVSSGLNHQWKEVDKSIGDKQKTGDEKKAKKSSKSSSNLVDSKEQELEEKVDDFLNKHVQNKSNFDIGSIMSQRLAALKILSVDANNITALNQLKKAEDLINEWSKSKSQNENENNKQDINNSLGQNTITIDNQTYQTCSDFTKAAASKDGIGMALLCKMGWQPGQGLGKNNEGTIEPLIPELKLDTKGLITEEEKPFSRRNNVQAMYNIPQPVPNSKKAKNKLKKSANSSNDLNSSTNSINPVNSISSINSTDSINKTVNSSQTTCEKLTSIANQSIVNGKHPVNILQEVSLKRKWKQPIYTIVSETGPPHKKNFLFKCTLNNVDYLPSFSSPNKKLAKAISALVCLQSFGLVNFDEVKS